MQTEERWVGDLTILRLVGRLELHEGDAVLRASVNRLVADGRTQVLLDLSGITRLDSAGLGMLVAKLLTALRRGGTIKLLLPPPRALQLLDTTKLTSIFEIFHDEEEAIRSFGVLPS